MKLIEETEISDAWEWIIERAAILEFDGGIARGDEALAKAFTLWYSQFVEARMKVKKEKIDETL